jgi:predicted lipid-binding transport protein (Tim44 family)
MMSAKHWWTSQTAFEFKIQDLFNNLWSGLGFVVGILAFGLGFLGDLTGFGAVIGVILNILGILIGMAAWWHSQRIKAEEQIATCNEASATAAKTIESLGKIQL